MSNILRILVYLFFVFPTASYCEEPVASIAISEALRSISEAEAAYAFIYAYDYIEGDKVDHALVYTVKFIDPIYSSDGSVMLSGASGAVIGYTQIIGHEVKDKKSRSISKHNAQMLMLEISHSDVFQIAYPQRPLLQGALRFSPNGLTFTAIGRVRKRIQISEDSLGVSATFTFDEKVAKRFFEPLHKED